MRGGRVGMRHARIMQVSSKSFTGGLSPMPPKTCVALLWRLLGIAATVMVAGAALPAAAQDSVKLGLVAAMSGQSAKSGEAIVRGISLAIEEINAKGGVLGKKIEL